MNATILHRTPLDVAKCRATGFGRLPFAEGLFQTKGHSAILESSDLETPFPFDDLVGSLSATVPDGGLIELAVKVRVDAEWSPWHELGEYSLKGWQSPQPRRHDSDFVDVDTLKLKRKATALRYRLRVKAGRHSVKIRSVAFAVSDANAPKSIPRFSGDAAIRDLKLAPRSQMQSTSAERRNLCSPTSLAMVLQYWGYELKTEQVARAVKDLGSSLFGNWPANVAFAGSLNLEAHVARLESLSDLENEISQGRPVIVSVTFAPGELPRAPLKKTAGHVLVVGGFTASGDIIAYDPAGKTKSAVRRIYARRAFHKVWRVHKRGLAYLIGPTFPRRASVGVPAADLWSTPAPRATSPGLNDPEHLSQLLYGERVTALESKGEWVRVTAEEQPSLLPAGQWQGYPGWISANALISSVASEANVIVRMRQTLLQRGNDLLTLSVGTRLPLVSSSRGAAFVRLLDGSLAEVDSHTLYTPPHDPTTASRAEIIRTAELFLGTSYYWGGRSGVQPNVKTGVDCSGLVSLAYRIHGRDVPRDSHEQKLKARAIRRSELRCGDLVFLSENESGDKITHVMIYTGGDGLIESRKSSGRVLRTTFLERFGIPLTSIESADAVTDLSFETPRRRRIFFGSYF